jgi:hypothetical protein
MSVSVVAGPRNQFKKPFPKGDGLLLCLVSRYWLQLNPLMYLSTYDVPSETIRRRGFSRNSLQLWPVGPCP